MARVKRLAIAASVVRNAFAISSGAERAQGLESECRLVLRRQCRMAAREHQPQPAVSDFAFKNGRFARHGIGRPLLHERDDLRFLVVKKFFAPDQIEREVLCRLRKPRGRIFWNPGVGPRPQRPDERFLDDIFSQLQSIDPKNPSENRDQLSRLVTKQVVGQARNLVCCWGSILFRAIGLTSLFAVVGLLESRDVDLVHLQHRVHDPFRFCGVLVRQHLDQHHRNDLP